MRLRNIPGAERRIGSVSALLVLGLVLALPALAQTFTLVEDAGNPIVTDPAPAGNKYYGAAWVDYDGDGDLDLYVAQDFLYRNDGGGAFTRIEGSGLADGMLNGGAGFDATGCSWADYDNDGDPDAYLSGRLSFLYRNDGSDTFTRIDDGDIGDGFANRGWSCAWGDMNNDSYVDLAITHPAGFIAGGPPLPNHLFMNLGSPSFELNKITEGPIPDADSLDAYTVGTWSDHDDDGDLDYFIGSGPANGTLQPDNLYRNLLDGGAFATFEYIEESPIATDDQDGQVWNWIDYDNDGDLDAYVTNWGGSLGGVANRLYRQEGDGTFTSILAGEIVTDTDVSLSSTWADFDNDGDLDCYVGNDGAAGVSRYYSNDGDGTFTRVDASPLSDAVGAHRSSTAGDWDNDGDQDLFVNGPATDRELWRNDTDNGNHWINLTLEGTISNGSGIGAKVRAKATISALAGSGTWQMREVLAQNSFNGHNSLRVHFGLGDATTVDSLVVEWPSGIVNVMIDVPADQFLDIIEDAPADAPESPEPSGELRSSTFPNPFDDATSIRFVIPSPAPVRLAIHDVTGRRVRLLADGEVRSAGLHTMVWDGRSDAGVSVASGSYYYRLEAGPQTQSRPVFYVR